MSQVPSAKELVTFVFGDGGIPLYVSEKEVASYRPKIIEWIREHCVTLTSETWDAKTLDEIEKIDLSTQTLRIAYTELAELQSEFQKQCPKIEQAKATMIAKWRSGTVAHGSGPNPAVDAKVEQLEKWANEKMDVFKKHIATKESLIAKLDKKVDCEIMSLISALKLPDVDSETDALVKELEAKFDHMVIDVPTSPNLETTSGEMNAATLALKQCTKLPDGPAKKSLMDDLEAAITDQASKTKQCLTSGC